MCIFNDFWCIFLKTLLFKKCWRLSFLLNSILKKFVYMYTLYRDFHRQGSFPHFFNVRTWTVYFYKKPITMKNKIRGIVMSLFALYCISSNTLLRPLLYFPDTWTILIIYAFRIYMYYIYYTEKKASSSYNKKSNCLYTC